MQCCHGYIGLLENGNFSPPLGGIHALHLTVTAIGPMRLPGQLKRSPSSILMNR